MTDFTPSTESVRNIYVEAGEDEDFNEDEANAEFTRWLSVHDAQVAADALFDVANELSDAFAPEGSRGEDFEVGFSAALKWLRDHTEAGRTESEGKTR